MHIETMLVFGATILPLVCTPGPDILFITSQGLTGGKSAALRANTGVIAGYIAHASLGVMGIAAIVAASPTLFAGIRWVGVAYLVYLAIRMLWSAALPGETVRSVLPETRALLTKGFLTSFLNPKGLLVYLIILPNFISPDENAAWQIMAFSAVIVFLCTLIYGAIGLTVASIGRRNALSPGRRRCVEGVAGGLLLVAAQRLASN